MKKLFILTGPVHTGKTSRLMHWATQKKNIDGIFQPVIDDKRFIYHIASRTLRQLETDETRDVTMIGKFKFSNQTFDWAKNILGDCINKELEWLVIDEIGPLELEGKGLEPTISKLFSEIEKFNGNILCVVRDSILEKFVEHYRLESKYDLINLDQD
ncbi:MAG: hypothetical protein NTZ27_12785 [Ignavibacteriales bacterium]|nr:hypothetical protein [Ignavibacteriales bacterium]